MTTDDEFFDPDWLAERLDDIEAKARGSLKDVGKVLDIEHLCVADFLEEPSFRSASDAEKRRILDATHTITIVAQVRARMGISDLKGAKRFLGYLNANFGSVIKRKP